MKKNILLIISLLLNLTLFSQGRNLLYATFEDFKNNKPLEEYDIEVDSWTSLFGLESFKIKNGNSSQRVNLTKFPAPFFLYQDKLMRINDGHCFFILVEGSNCFYSQFSEINYEKTQLYTSETITGKMVKFKSKNLEKLLQENGLLNSYQNDEPKKQRTEMDSKYFFRRVQWYSKYYELLNTKLKK